MTMSPDHGMAADWLDSLPVRMISRDFACQIHPGRDPYDLLVAATDGRYHCRGWTSPLYASASKYAALCELLRQFIGDDDLGVLASETARHIGVANVHNLPVADVTDERVRQQLHVSEAQLVSDNYEVCHAIARHLRSRPDRFGGILAPSAATRGEVMLVVFPDRIRDHVRMTRPALRADAAAVTRSPGERWIAGTTIAQTVIELACATAAIAGVITALTHFL
jgi:RES domain-containing protein